MRTALTIPFVLALASTFAFAADVAADANVNLMDEITALHARDGVNLDARSAKHSGYLSSKKTSAPKSKVVHVNNQAQSIVQVPAQGATTLGDAAAYQPATTLVAAAVIDPSSSVVAAPVDSPAATSSVASPSFHPVTGPSGSTYNVGYGFDKPTPVFVPHFPKRDDDTLEERDAIVLPKSSAASKKPKAKTTSKAKSTYATAKKAAATIAKPIADTFKGPNEEIYPVNQAASTTGQASIINANAAAIVPTVIVNIPATQIPAILATTSLEAQVPAQAEAPVPDPAATNPDDSQAAILSMIEAAEGADATTAGINVASNAGALASQAATMSPQTGQYGGGYGVNRATPTFTPNFPAGVHKRFAKQKRH